MPAKLFKPNTMPWYLPVLLVITTIYLLVEISFASFLVDILGSQADQEVIDRTEHAGRLISGAALALAIWGFQLPKFSLKRPLRSIAVLIISASIAITGVYHGERWLVDTMADTSIAPVKQQAMRALAVREELFVEKPSIVGIHAPAPSVGDATWSAFRGLFPFISLFQDDVLSLNEDGETAAINAGVAATVPDAATFDRDILGALFQAAEVRYDLYLEAVQGRNRGIESAAGQVNRAWDQNVDAMYRLRILGANATDAKRRQNIPRLRREVQSRGIAVPNNWIPTDKETFQRAAWNKVMPQVNKAYNDALDRIFGRSVQIPPDLQNFDAFLRNPSVQNTLRSDLGLETPGAAVLPGLDNARLTALHSEYVTALSARLRAAYLGDPEPFRYGQEFYEVGATAMRALIVPPMALSLSLLGAIVHLIKFFNYLVAALSHGRSRFGIRRFLRNHPRLRFGSAALGAFALLAASYTPANAIVDSSYYRDASHRMDTRVGIPVGVGIGITISMQNVISPVGETVRMLGVFSPIEEYLVADSLPPQAATIAIVSDIPFPLPRPHDLIDASMDVSAIDVPLPRPRPDNL